MADRTTSPTTITATPVIATHSGVWALDGGGLGRRFDGDITAVAVDDDDGLLVLEDERHVHRLDGSGSTTRLASLTSGVRATTLLRHGDHVWLGTDPAQVWRVADDGARPVDAFTDAPTSDQWHTPWGGPAAVFSLAGHGDDLYVAVHVGGILRTSDAGRSWTPTIDLHVDVHQVAVHDDGTVWAATGMNGLASSTDRGASWTYHRRGLHATYALAVAPVRGGTLVAVASGHGATDGALYRMDGDELVPARTGLPRDLHGAVGPRRLAARGERAVVALPDGSIHVSDDGGRSWDEAGRLEGVTEVVLAPAS